MATLEQDRTVKEASSPKEVALSFIERLEDREELMPHAEALQTIKQISNIFGDTRWSSMEDAPWPNLIKTYGFYTVITQEFMQELLKELFRRKLTTLPAIEVCAGRGVLSHHLQRAGLNIVAIDNSSDSRTANRSLADNFDCLSHREALIKYQPKLVIGNWIPNTPEIGHDILEFPSVDYFIDIGEYPPNSTWLTHDYKQENFRLKYLHNVTRYAIGTTDYFWMQKGRVRRTSYTEVRLWKRKGAPMSLDHTFD